MVTEQEQIMLNQIDRIAFVAENGKIDFVNLNGLGKQLVVGEPVRPLLLTGKKEYAEFTEGCLSLSMNIADTMTHVSVLRSDGRDIIIEEPSFVNPDFWALSSSSQELRSPLFKAMICADALANSKEAFTENQCSQFAELKRNLFQMHRSVCNMSDVSNSQKFVELQQENYNIKTLSEELFAKLQSCMSETGHDLKISSKLPPYFTMINRELYERAILNLVSNAAKYCSNNKTISIKATGGMHSFSISITNHVDTTKTQKNQDIFSKYLAERLVSRERACAGLGLYMVRNTALYQNGTLLINKPSNSRIRFTLNLPIVKPNTKTFRSDSDVVDYAGGYNHILIELSDILPLDLYV